MSRTATYNGFQFESTVTVSSKSKPFEDCGREILPNAWLTRPVHRVFYGGNVFSYPLKPIEARSSWASSIDSVRSFMV